MRVIDTIPYEQLVQLLNKSEITNRIHKSLEFANEYTAIACFNVLKDFSNNRWFYTQIECITEDVLRQRRGPLGIEETMEKYLVRSAEFSYNYDKKDLPDYEIPFFSANVLQVEVYSAKIKYSSNVGLYERNPEEFYTNMLEISLKEKDNNLIAEACQIKQRAFSDDETVRQIGSLSRSLVDLRKRNTIRCCLTYDQQNKIWKGTEALKPFCVEIVQLE